MRILFIILTALTPAFASAQTTQPLSLDNNPAVGQFYDLNGFKMYAEVYGSGSPLLMIHGNGGSIKSFSANVPFFLQHHQVIVADSRSQGRSADPDHPLTFEMMADDSAALLDALHVDSADVIGHSDGGIVALLLAIRHPEKVKRLIASGANVTPDADAFCPGVWDKDHARYEREKDQPHATDKEKNDWKLFMLDWDQPHITPAMLQQIACPCLIVCGDHDLISVPHTVSIYQNIRHANLWVIPDSGHGTLREHAEEFNQKSEQFLTQPFKDHP